jgi:hypothetical protein
MEYVERAFVVLDDDKEWFVRNVLSFSTIKSGSSVTSCLQELG